MKNKKIVNDAFFETEMAWKKEQNQRDFGGEILETMTYQETKDILAPVMENRIDIKSALNKSYKKIIRLVKKQYAPETFEFDFVIKALWILKFMNKDMENQDQLKNLERFWFFNESRKHKSKIHNQPSEKNHSLMIEEAKRVPIETLFNNPYKKSGRNTLMSLCPFHKEKTPSFTIFIDTNTFFCFGCGAKGDVITFYQKIYGVDFVEAVKSLTGQH